MRAQLSSISFYRASLWNLRRRQILPARHLLSAAGVAAPLGVLGGWGVSVLYLPPFVRPWHSVSLEGHSGGFLPLGQLLHSGGVGAPRRLNLPSHSPEIPRGFPPLRRPQGPHLCLPLQRTCWPGFLLAGHPLTLPFFRLMVALLHLYPQRWRPRRLLRPLDCLLCHLSPIPLSLL